MILDKLNALPLTGDKNEMQHQPRVQDQNAVAPLQRAIFSIHQLSESGSIEPTIRELVKIRASQINGCAYCLAMHWPNALKAGERIDRLTTLEAWWECDWYSPRERAALAWTEALTKIADHEVSDELFNTCRQVFSEQEMIDLTAGIIEINSWNRLAIGLSSRPDPFSLNGDQ